MKDPRMLMRMWLKVLVLRPGKERKKIDKSADGPREWEGVEEAHVLLRLEGGEIKERA